jgi:hypothetical protein
MLELLEVDDGPVSTMWHARHHTAGATVARDALAVYVHRRSLAVTPIDTVWMLVTSVDECPGSMAIAIDVDEAMTITAERRLHSLESMRACYDASDLPDGWWTDVPLPLPFPERELNAAVREALGLFSAAGLPSPSVTSITFDPYHEDCDDRRGYSDWSRAGMDIHLCMDVDTVHWFADAAPSGETGDDEARSVVGAMSGASSWNDHDDPWADRGIEWAAEALRWGFWATRTQRC